MTWDIELFKNFIDQKRNELCEIYGTKYISAYDARIESSKILNEEIHLKTYIKKQLCIVDPIDYLCHLLGGSPITELNKEPKLCTY